MKKFLPLFLLLPFLFAFAPHDQDNAPDSAANASPAGFGQDGPFNVSNIEILSHLTLAQYGGGPANILANDCWGWTDPMTGKEYALCGLMHATSFVDISQPRDPKYLGRVLTNTGVATWRDMKVYQDHVFIVSDANQQHGMQVFDLTRLRNADPENPQDFSVDALYGGGSGNGLLGNAHNIAINEDSGFAYVVGSNLADGGLHIIDIRDPKNPVHAGDFAADGYTHDVSVFTYSGPDTQYQGREIAFACNIDTLTIVDVTDKQNTVMLARNDYPSEYAHQCWITEDHRYIYLNDELDESGGEPTRIHVFDCLDLDSPVYLGFIPGPTSAVDHNLYINGDKLYLANYSAGLRVFQLDANDPMNMTEIGFLDTFNADDAADFDGVWSVYPFFESGSI
ncbi:MAG: choice-of-anchor B family protein, partial [Planctomycetota bacterium]